MSTSATDGPAGDVEADPRVTDEERALLCSVADRPDDDLPRLVYADWLDEHARPDQAELIRLQCQLARPDDMPDDDRRRLRERARVLVHRTPPDRWVPFRSLSRYEVEFGRGFPRGVVLTPAEANAFCEWVLPQQPTLRHLRFAQFGPDDLPTLRLPAEQVRGRVIDFTQSRLGDDGCRTLAADCPWLAQVAALGLAYNAVGSDGLQALARSPAFDRGGMDPLGGLYLCGNRVTDGGVQALVSHPVAAGLRVLDLTDNRLGDAVAEAIARSPHLGALQELSLVGNPVSPAGVKAILDSETLPSLTKLSVGDTFGLSRLQAEADRRLAVRHASGRRAG